MTAFLLSVSKSSQSQKKLYYCLSNKRGGTIGCMSNLTVCLPVPELPQKVSNSEISSPRFPTSFFFAFLTL